MLTAIFTTDTGEINFRFRFPPTRVVNAETRGNPLQASYGKELSMGWTRKCIDQLLLIGWWVGSVDGFLLTNYLSIPNSGISLSGER